MPTELAHLRFADDVYPVVVALQALMPLHAKPAREVFEDAPDDWYVVGVMIDRPSDIVRLVERVLHGGDVAFDQQLLSTLVVPDGNRHMAVFFNLRGMAQAIH